MGREPTADLALLHPPQELLNFFHVCPSHHFIDSREKLKTTYASRVSFLTKSWATPITLPIKYRDLPHSAQLAFTILDVTLPDGSTHASPLPPSNDSPPSNDHKTTDSFMLSNSAVVGGTTLALFGKKRTLRKGKQRCFVHVRRTFFFLTASQTICLSYRLLASFTSVTALPMEMFRRQLPVKLRLFLSLILIHWKSMRRVTSWVDSKKLVVYGI